MEPYFFEEEEPLGGRGLVRAPIFGIESHEGRTTRGGIAALRYVSSILQSS